MAELLRPGVEVIQTLRNQSPTFIRPTLVPCIVGPAFEIINVLNTDGTINSKAKYGAYSQIGKTITQSAFPDHRGNIDELDIIESSIRPFILAGGSLSELLMNPGESFLATSHVSSKPAILTTNFSGPAGLPIVGTVLVISLDNPVPADTSRDITITFKGTGPTLTAAQCAEQINEAVGQEIASVVGSAPNDKVLLTTPRAGAKSSITIRAGASANGILGIGDSGEERVVGSGYRAQDDNDNDTTSPWIEFYRGAYFLNGAEPPAFPSKAGLINVETGVFSVGKAAAITFGESGTIPLKVGDLMFGDGVKVKNAEVMKVESDRFRLGTVNTTLSTADSNGRYITKVYDPVEVETLFDDNPFSPQYVWFKAANLFPSELSPVAASVTGTNTGSAATKAEVKSSAAITVPVSLAGLKIHYVSTINGVDTEGEFTFTGGPFGTVNAIASAIGTNIPGVSAVEGSGPDSGKLVLESILTGRNQAIRIKADGTANAALNFSTTSDTVGTGKDVEFAGLNGKTLSFTLDKNPHVYSVTFSSDSLDIAVDEINSVVGANVASKAGAGLDRLKLTSTLKGAASEVRVYHSPAADADTVFGLSTLPAAGSGRPYPDAYLDGVNNLVIGSQILRDQVTGYPLDFATNSGDLYIQFKGLRKDVSPAAKVAGVLRIPDQATLASVLDPLTEENPLGLALFMCLINAPGLEVKGLGVDEISASAPEGTEAAYARAAGFLESEEVYAIAPLTHNEVVHGIWSTHVVAMSAPEQGGERIVFINKKMPVEANPIVAASGTKANSTATNNQMLLDVNPAAGLVAAGINPALPIPVSAGVFMEFEVNGEFRRYNVSSVSGSLVNLNVTFTGSQNTDGFYTTTALTETVVNASWSLKVRGKSLIIPGSNPPRLDYSLVAETVAQANSGIKNRRLYSVFPDTIKTTIGGVEKRLPGYYACAAIAGMCAGQPPQQGFTNFPIVGLTGVVGTEKFSKKQLNNMAGGGTYILIQDVQGGPVSSRHQVSTDLTSIETRELSITKVVDFTAKFLRSSIKKFIGVQTINEQFLDTVGTTIQGILNFLVETGVLNGAELNNILQDEENPDTVLVDITLDVPYPANYIRLTLVV
jgi:hypothetical protein